MARPKVPLISRRRAFEVALDIIDREGIDALSIRRLADAMSINGASLYYHFENKDEIVVGAAKLALEEVRTPQVRDEPWRVWLVRNGRRLRSAFLDHPHLLPVMLRREALGIGAAQLDATAARLEEDGVPIGAIAPMLEALELYAISSAMHEAREADGRSERPVHLSRASAERAFSPAEIYDLVCEQIIDATLATAHERAAAGTKKSAVRSRTSTARSAPAPAKTTAKTTAKTDGQDSGQDSGQDEGEDKGRNTG